MRIKHIGYYLYLIIVLGLCITPLLAMDFRPGLGNTENRTPAPWPVLSVDNSFNWNCLEEAGAYFTDRFAFRQELVAADAKVRAKLFQVSPVEDVIVGEGGWLYYSATLDDYQHKNNVSERMLFNMAHNVALMQQYAESLGKKFVFTVAPNKNSLYGGNMPERLRFREGEKSDMERLVPWLLRENVHYVDLSTLFKAQDEVLYYARDSPWNEKGAVMVYNALLDACGKPHERYDTLSIGVNGNYYGDLNLMLYPVGAEPEPYVCYPIRFTWEYVEGEAVEDPFIQTGSPNGEGSLLMYRDSFGNSLLPYMAEAFGRATFSKQVPYPMTDLVTCAPDTVILEKVERHLPTLGKVPPLMSGLLQGPGGGAWTSVESSATLQVSKEGSYWKLEGMADPAYMDTDSRIYIEVDDGHSVQTYEAFCVNVTQEGDDFGDYGYILYLSELLVENDTLKVRLLTERENQTVVLLEKEIHMNL